MEFSGNDDVPKPPPNAASHAPHFPLLWILIPQILAFVSCSIFPWFSEIPVSRHLFAGTFFLLLSVTACACEHFFSESSKISLFTGTWKLCFPIAAFFIFCAWWDFRSPPFENRENQSPREVHIEFRIERAFSTSEKNFNGLAIVEKISGEGVENLTGTKIWFSVPKKLFSDKDEFPSEGIFLHAKGILSGTKPTEFLNGGFLRYLKRERVSAVFSRAESVEILPRNEFYFTRWCSQIKIGLRQKLFDISEGNKWRERSGRVLGAMLLGDRTLLLPEQKNNFLLTGTMHVFAVSGLHVSILAAGMFGVLRFFRIPSLPAWIAMLISLWIYTQIVGAPPSAMRAWAMLFFIFVGTLSGRGRMAFHGLLCSAFFALTLNPGILTNTGFQLSYLVVAAILLYGIPLSKLLEDKFAPDRWIPKQAYTFSQRIRSRLQNLIISGSCISLSAFLAGTPIVTAMFGVCSFTSLAANIVLIPFVSLAAWTGAATLLISELPYVGIFLGKTIFSVASIPLVLVDFGTEFFSKFPGIARLTFPYQSIGIIGSLLLLTVFFFGEIHSKLRERPILRFSLPPLILSVFLLVFAY